MIIKSTLTESHCLSLNLNNVHFAVHIILLFTVCRPILPPTVKYLGYGMHDFVLIMD